MHICDGRKKAVYIKDIEQIVEVSLLEKLRSLRVRGKRTRIEDNQKLNALKTQIVD
jgi:hypothetical protein